MNEKVLAEASDLLRASAQEPEKALPWMIAWAACTAKGEDLVAEEDAVKRFARRMEAAAQLLSPTCPHCGKHLDQQPFSAPGCWNPTPCGQCKWCVEHVNK